MVRAEIDEDIFNTEFDQAVKEGVTSCVPGQTLVLTRVGTDIVLVLRAQVIWDARTFRLCFRKLKDSLEFSRSRNSERTMLEKVSETQEW